MVKFLSYSKKKRRKISSNNDSFSFAFTRCLSLSLVVPLVVNRCHSLYHSFSLFVTRCTTRSHSLSLDVPLVRLFINDRIFVMFINKEVCEVVLVVSSSTDYEFSAAIFIFKALMWSVYYYHEILADTERQENYKRLVAYGFHSWQISWYLTPRREKLFMKTSIGSRLRPICSWFSFDSSSN